MSDYFLKRTEDRLALHAPEAQGFKPLYVDFTCGKAQHRRVFPGKELLAKAVGYGKRVPTCVIDATAGLGREAFLLASLGSQVILLERSPWIYALLEDGIARARQVPETAPIVERMQLIEGDARSLLPRLEGDVIYLDPMYPKRKKSALVKKDMRILRALQDDEDDSDQLLHTALFCKSQRVVVKRPRYGENLAELVPHFSYNGKSTRFDIYMK